VLTFDIASAVAFSKVVVSASTAGNEIDFADASIAAIAVAQGYVLVTRNVRDFAGTGAQIVNPWMPSGASPLTN
jgi:toxin FitB